MGLLIFTNNKQEVQDHLSQIWPALHFVTWIKNIFEKRLPDSLQLKWCSGSGFAHDVLGICKQRLQFLFHRSGHINNKSFWQRPLNSKNVWRWKLLESNFTLQLTERNGALFQWSVVEGNLNSTTSSQFAATLHAKHRYWLACVMTTVLFLLPWREYTGTSSGTSSGAVVLGDSWWQGSQNAWPQGNK